MDTPKIHILVGDTAREMAERLERLFPGQHITVAWESSLDALEKRFEKIRPDVLVMQEALFGSDPERIRFLEGTHAKSPGSQVLILGASRPDTDPASERSFCRYVADQPADSALRRLVERALEQRPRTALEVPAVDGQPAIYQEQILGHSPAMQRTYRQIRQAAATEIPVLIVGDTGTGKDLAAQAIHLRSERRDGPFVPVHLGALPQELVASELFGHEKGSFTGALEQRAGKFEAASDGTIFLDEVSTLDERVQISLLRLIEEKRFNRLGGLSTYTTNARIIAATNEDLGGMVDQGVFREDLLYRMDVFRVSMPPLRERLGDIPLLAYAFLDRYRVAFNKEIYDFSAECMAALEAYDWPGNVRELKNVVQRAILVATEEEIGPEHLPSRFRAAEEQTEPQRVSFDVGTPLAVIEREMILRTLAAARNRKTAAELLGISRRTLYNKMRKHHIR